MPEAWVTRFHFSKRDWAFSPSGEVTSRSGTEMESSLRTWTHRPTPVLTAVLRIGREGGTGWGATGQTRGARGRERQPG